MDIKNILILVFLIACSNCQIIDIDPNCGQSASFQSSDKNIVGAIPSKEGQAGWQTLIRENNRYKCGGSLISKFWVLTAASCVYRNLNPSSYLINLGVYNISDNKYTTRSVSKIIIHPAYDELYKKYDIALIKLADSVDNWLNEPRNFNIIPICVPDGSEDYETKKAIATGYASFTTGFISNEEIKNKQNINLTILNDNQCKSNHPQNTPNSFIQVCAVEDNEREGKCGLDRGGPLAVQGQDSRWHLIGITSWGYNPCSKGGVFTRISTFADYIINIISTE